MIFKPQLLEQIFAGEKTVTRRPVKPGEAGYRVGQVLSIQPGMARNSVGRIRLTGASREPLGQIARRPGEAGREGFGSFTEFLDYWRSLYKGKWDPSEEVWRLEFELLEQTHEICSCCGGAGVEEIEAE